LVSTCGPRSISTHFFLLVYLKPQKEHYNERSLYHISDKDISSDNFFYGIFVFKNNQSVKLILKSGQERKRMSKK
jgi:hypothetical protein